MLSLLFCAETHNRNCSEVLIYNKLVLTTVAFPSRILAKMGMVTSCIGAALQVRGTGGRPCFVR